MRQLLLWIALLVAPALAMAADRGVERVAVKLDASKKVALVIGNGAYVTQPLVNPVIDAKSMAEALGRYGFQVIVHTDADRTTFVAALAKFRDSLQGAGVGLFYFAGHGVQMDGQNYLLPTRTDMAKENEVRFNTIKLEDILETFEKADTPMKIIILDACRNNPFQRTRGGEGGLAAVTRAPKGTLIAYSTAPGRVAKDGIPGKNGVYTEHLLQAMKEPGLPVEHVFKLTRARVADATTGQQIPWESTSLTGHLTFHGTPKPGAAPAAVVAAARDPDKPVARGFEPRPRPAGAAPGTVFKDCERCPEMVVVPQGPVRMGSPTTEQGRQANEDPRKDPVSIHRPFAVGRFEVTFAEWSACLLDGGCDRWPDDRGWGRDKRPVIDVSWEEANRYAKWLSRSTGREYRLLSESEWEHAARAGTTMARHWGENLDQGKARCADCNKDAKPGTAEVGSYGENPWKIADMLGNVWEWTADCYAPTLAALPADGAAVATGDCSQRSMRGGSWLTSAKGVRAATRAYFPAGKRAPNVGFRVASTID